MDNRILKLKRNTTFSFLSSSILKSNNITKEKELNFIKELRITLRLDYGLKAIDVRKLNNNEVIEKWYSFNSLPENRITGSNE